MTCKVESCGRTLGPQNKSGFCRTHRNRAPHRNDPAYRRAYYLAHKEKEIQQVREWRKANPERYVELREGWKARNPDLVNKHHREYRKRKSDREILALMAAARKAPKPLNAHNSALLKLAEAKASQAQYGIERIGYQR